MAGSAYLTWLGQAIIADRDAPTPSVDRMGEDMVLGYATGYGVAEIAAFVRSLRAVFTGPAVLVVDQDPDLLAFLERYDIEPRAPRGSQTGGWKPHAVVERFAEFADLLAQRPWIRNVLLTDVRDVIFQASPFEPPLDQLEFFDEYDGRPLGDHAFNTKHLKAIGGEDFARSISGKPCVCVGTVIGPRESVIQLCRAILLIGAIPRSTVGGAFGADQAACNVVAHLRLVNSVVRPNYTRVATIGLTSASTLAIRDETILNPDGGVSPIVHQYDRHAVFNDFVNQRWRSDLRPASRNQKTLGSRARRMRESLFRRLPEFR
jgi:hypothetical protein